MKAEVKAVEERITRNLNGRGLIAGEMPEEALRSVMLHAGMGEKEWADYVLDKQQIAELEPKAKVELRTKAEPPEERNVTEDMAALIARQQAEQAAREALPGRYDGATVADIAHRVEMEHMAIAALKANSAAVDGDAEARLRAVAAQSPQAAAAFGLLNAGAPVVVVIDESGTPIAEPTRDVDVIASWFEPDSPYSTRWPATPCGEQGGLFGLVVTGDGVDWLKKVATVHRPTRVERLMAAVVDPVTAMGVPRPRFDWDDDDPQPKPDELRATAHSRLWMVEDVPAQRAVVRSWNGSIRSPAGQAAMAAGRPPEARQLSGMVWSWPQGQTLPVGRPLRNGVESLAAIPAHGAVLKVGGAMLVVRSILGLVSPPPDWLIAAVQELA